MQTVHLLNIWTGIRSNLIARHLIWYDKNIYECSSMLDKHDFYRVIVLVTKTTDDGSKQAYYVRAFYAGCLFPGGATANTGVC